MKPTFLALAALPLLSGCGAGMFGAAGLGTLMVFEADVDNQRHDYKPTGSYVARADRQFPVETRYVYQKDKDAIRYLERVVDVDGSKVECGDSCPDAVDHFLTTSR